MANEMEKMNEINRKVNQKFREKFLNTQQKQGSTQVEPLSDKALEDVAGGLDEISAICSWLGCSG